MKKIESILSRHVGKLVLPLLLITLAAAARLVDHAPNFTPLGAMALFSGAYLFSRGWKSRAASIAVPLIALFVSDLVIGFYSPGVMVAVYGSFVVSIAIGWLVRTRVSVGRIAVGSLAGSVQFFLVTNFAVWLFQHGAYERTFAGLMQAYVQGIPFFRNTLAGDMFYAVVIFGTYAIAQQIVSRIFARGRAAHATHIETN